MSLSASRLQSQIRNPKLPLARFRLIFRSPHPVDPDWYLGSAWRGVLGHELMAKACPSAGCDGGQHAPECNYLYLFETPKATGQFADSGVVPHPLVLSIPWRTGLGRNDFLSIQVSIFGRAVSLAGLVLDALRHGAGRLRPAGPLELVSLEQEGEPGSGDWRMLQQGASPHSGTVRIPPPPLALKVSMLTPLRLRIQDREITPSTFLPGHLFRNLLRRVSLLAAHHTDTPLETDFAGLTRLAEQVHMIREDLSWYDMDRYSSRQGHLVPMGGILGTFEISLSHREALWPYFWLGQFTHAGKGTAMGLGRYRLWTN